MNQGEKDILRNSLLGGLSLFIIAFPLINILLVEFFTLIAEGTWRLPFRERSALTVFVGYWITILPWVVLLRRYKTRAESRRILRIKFRIDGRTTLVCLILLGGFVAARFLRPHESSLISTTRAYQEVWGGVWGIIITVSLYAYYVFEGVMMALITDAFQTAGESCFQKRWIPWGGIGLALTWGASHFYTKGLSMGIAAVLFGLFTGVLFVLGKRSPWPPVMAWMLNYFY
jgi:hypothetical protein